MQMRGLRMHVLWHIFPALTIGWCVLQVCWAGPHTLALASRQDAAVRMLQLDTDDNFTLDLDMQEIASSSSMSNADLDATAAAGGSTGIVGLVYEPVQRVLAVATSTGWICLFEHWMSKAQAAAAAAAAPDPASEWQSAHVFWVSCKADDMYFALSHVKCNASHIDSNNANALC